VFEDDLKFMIHWQRRLHFELMEHIIPRKEQRNDDPAIDITIYDYQIDMKETRETIHERELDINGMIDNETNRRAINEVELDTNGMINNETYRRGDLKILRNNNRWHW